MFMGDKKYRLLLQICDRLFIVITYLLVNLIHMQNLSMLLRKEKYLLYILSTCSSSTIITLDLVREQCIPCVMVVGWVVVGWMGGGGVDVGRVGCCE